MTRQDPPLPDRGPKIRRDARRHPREKVSWPVTVDDGKHLLHAQTLDVSASGAKIRLRERLELGAQVRLEFRPPGRQPVELRAIVRRLDADGPAFVFLGTHGEDLLLHPGQPATASGQPARAKATGTVLLLDDDAAACALAHDALESEGYTVLDAGDDPVRAVRIAREHPGPIHLLLSDLVMPLMSGAQLVERLLPLRPEMKVLFMSADPASRVPVPGARILSKPFTADGLAAKVREVLEGRSPFARRTPGPPRG